MLPKKQTKKQTNTTPELLFCPLIKNGVSKWAVQECAPKWHHTGTSPAYDWEQSLPY